MEKIINQNFISMIENIQTKKFNKNNTIVTEAILTKKAENDDVKFLHISGIDVNSRETVQTATITPVFATLQTFGTSLTNFTLQTFPFKTQVVLQNDDFEEFLTMVSQQLIASIQYYIDNTEEFDLYHQIGIGYDECLYVVQEQGEVTVFAKVGIVGTIKK